jgi:NADPH-dependent curcumin reductase CurA
MRGRMSDAPSYAASVAIGGVMVGHTVGEVIASKNPGFRTGDVVAGYDGWQTHGVSNGKELRVLDRSLPITTALGVLGMPGMTAYVGLLDIGQPKAGETVVVSAASGAVGSIVGQLAKTRGCRAVGVAGSPEKCRYVIEELGFDACINYKTDELVPALAAACPGGVDVYFENVGGRSYEAVLPILNRDSRITLCGLVSQYGATDGRDAREVWRELGARTFESHAVSVHDLWVRNFVEDHQDVFLSRMAEWLRDGRVKYREDIWPGLEQAPRAFRAMLEGGNFGKTLVAVADDPTRRD